MSRFKVGLLLMMVMMLVVACGGDDGGDDAEGDSQSSDGGEATIVWEVTSNVSDFGDDINIRLGQLWLAGNTVMVDHVRSGDLNTYNLRYSAEDGSALEPLDFMIPRELLDSDDIGLDDVFFDESDGTYWAVTDTRGAPIIHFTEDSEIIAEYGVSPARGEDPAEGEIQNVEHIFVGDDGTIYVNETPSATSGQITAFTAEGDLIREFNYSRVEGSQHDMTVSGSGEIVITPISRQLAEYGFDVYDLEGNVLREDFGIGMAIEETRTTTSTPVMGVEIDAEGNAIFVARYYLYRLNPAGEIINVYDALATMNREANFPTSSESYRWQDVVLLPNGDAIAMYSNQETWTLVRISFG